MATGTGQSQSPCSRGYRKSVSIFRSTYPQDACASTSKHFAVGYHRVSPYDPRSIILQATTSVIITHPLHELLIKTASSLLIFVLFYHCCWWSWLQSLSSILAPWQRPKKTTNTNVYRLHEILSRYQEEYYLTTRSDTQPPLLLVPSRLARFGRTKALSWSSPWRSFQRTSGAYCTLFIDYNRHCPGLITSTTFCITATVTWSAAAAVTRRATL